MPTNICHCGRPCRDTLCWRCTQKRRLATLVKVKCRCCNRTFKTFERNVRHNRWRGILKLICPSCRRQAAATRLRTLRAQQTPDERVQQARLARACTRNNSATVRKQWDTIRSNPKKYSKAKARLRRISQQQWATMSDVERDRRITALTGSNACGRSKGNMALQKAMVDSGLYKGFVSEETFHGFVPDEINHELKLIVEYFGDIYHCNPRSYHNPIQYVSAIRRTVEEQWIRDRRRLGVFYRYGYTVIIVWEYDFKHNPQRELERIRDAISKKRAINGYLSQVRS